jgi:predicted nuclease with TOPRIM domain
MNTDRATPEPTDQNAGRTPATIPYPRFAEVVGERNAAQEQLEALNAKVAELTSEAEAVRAEKEEIEKKLEAAEEHRLDSEEEKAGFENRIRDYLEQRLGELSPETIETLPGGLTDLELLAHLDAHDIKPPVPEKEVTDVTIGAPSRPGPPGVTDEERLARLAREGDRRSLTALIRARMFGS